MAGTMNGRTAQVIALPGAVAEPVQNPRHRGRYPPGVFALSKARMQREWRRRAAVRQARADAEAAELARCHARGGAHHALERMWLSGDYWRDLTQIRIELALARQEAGLPPS